MMYMLNSQHFYHLTLWCICGTFEGNSDVPLQSFRPSNIHKPHHVSIVKTSSHFQRDKEALAVGECTSSSPYLSVLPVLMTVGSLLIRPCWLTHINTFSHAQLNPQNVILPFFPFAHFLCQLHPWRVNKSKRIFWLCVSYSTNITMTFSQPNHWSCRWTYCCVVTNVCDIMLWWEAYGFISSPK